MLQDDDEVHEPVSLMTQALDEVKGVFVVCLQQVELFYSPFVP